MVEQMISKRKKDWVTIHALRGLHDMRMVADNQVSAVLNQPTRLHPLGCVWQFLILTAPMDRDDHKVCLLARHSQFL